MASASGGCSLIYLSAIIVLAVIAPCTSYRITVPDSLPADTVIFDCSIHGARRYIIDDTRTPPIVANLLKVDSRTGLVQLRTHLRCDGLLYPNPINVFIESATELSHHVDFSLTELQVVVNGSECPGVSQHSRGSGDGTLLTSYVSVSLPAATDSEPICLHRSQLLVHFRDLLPSAVDHCSTSYRLVSDNRFAIEPFGEDLVSTKDQCMEQHMWRVGVQFRLKCPLIESATRTNNSSSTLVHKQELRVVIVFHSYVVEHDEIVHRIRREMTNQSPLFSRPSFKAAAPEDSEAGLVVTTLTANDPEDDLISYSMVAVVDSRSQQMFEINSQSGTVTTTKRLDREYMPVHYFQVRAVDSGRPPRTATTTLQIEVEDANDHAPVFEHEQYQTSVHESITLGSTVLTVRATDSDQADNARILYSLLNPHDANEAFHIDPQTGIITARLPLDRESHDHYNLTVQAIDQALPADRKSATAEVYIQVDDDNDNYPQFGNKSYRARVREDIDAGQRPVIARVSATDIDSGENARVRYAIIGGNIQDHFSIDPTSGQVSVNKPLDHESVQKYRLVIRAQDSGRQTRSNTTNLLVEVEDVNDNAPSFYSAHFHDTVQENVQSGFAIVRVQAFDHDDGRNAKIRYSLLSSDSAQSKVWPYRRNDRGRSEESGADLPFAVDPDTGWLRTRRLIDREQKHEYRLLVVAADQGTPALSATATVTIHVQDQNDNSPVFERNVYEITLSESTPVGTPVISVTATDPDSDERLTYQLSQGNTRNRFGMTSQSGVGLLALVRPLDYKLERHFMLKVTATDSGGRMDSATIYVNVSDANTHAPVFEGTPYSASVYEDVPIGTRVLAVVASDQDSGENARITYTLTGAAPPDFVIDSDTGEITTAQPLDRERRGSYLLTVSARDQGVPSLSDTTDVEVLVADVNDHSPQFAQRGYQATVSEAAEVGSSVVTVSASDPDQGLNGRVQYTFEGGNDGDGVFVVDPDSGQVRTGLQLDRETVASYRLYVLAVDQGSPRMTSSVEILVEVGDINDSPPSFDSDKIRLEVAENSPVGSLVGRIVARDPDAGANAFVEYSLVKTDESAGFELRTVESEMVAELYTQRELDYEADQKVFTLLVLAQSPPLRSYVTVEVHVTDVNDNPPQLQDFQVIFNNYKNSFPIGPIGRVPAVDADVTDQLIYTIRSGNNANLVSLNSTTGQLTLSFSLNTNVPKTARMEVAVTDGLNEVTAVMVLHVRLVTDNMLYNSVTVRLQDMTAESFLSPQVHSLFTDGLSAVLAVPRENIVIFSLLDDYESPGQILNVSFSALQTQSVPGEAVFISQQAIQENIYLKRSQLVQLTTLQVLPFDDNLCAAEPCSSFDQCVTILKFGNASGFIHTQTALFRPIYPRTTFACQCPPGFAGKREFYECDVEVDLCYSQPCMNGGTCRRREGGYTCVCALGYAGTNCQLDMGQGSCPSSRDTGSPRTALLMTDPASDLCRGRSSCTNLPRGGFVCGNCVSSPYHSTFCELTGRRFNTGGYLTLPAMRQRHRFNIRLKFSTRSSSGLLLYNGRLNGRHDFIALELVNDSLRFSFSVGGASSHVTVVSSNRLSDGEWHQVEIDYLNRSVTLVVDGCDRQMALKYADVLGGYTCANSTTMTLPERCISRQARCQRLLDLTGPLQVGGLPVVAGRRQVTFTQYIGCLRDFSIDRRLVDFNQYVSQNNTEPGCVNKMEFCAQRPCQNGGTCLESWGTFQCVCPDSYTGKRCHIAVDSVRSLSGDGYIAYSVDYTPLQLPWFVALGIRTRATRALLLQLQFSDMSRMRLQIESDSLVYVKGEQKLVLNSVTVNDGEWHHILVKWMHGEVWINVDYGVHELTRPTADSIEDLHVQQMLVGGLVEPSENDIPALHGCIRNVRAGESLKSQLEIEGHRNAKLGCTRPSQCRQTSCPANSVCRDTWDGHKCQCLPGHVGEQCVSACQLRPCENNSTCLMSSSDPRGYTCQCHSPLLYGDYCEQRREQPCPSKWWGYPVCGPCQCDERKGYDADCNKTTGQCGCKANHYKPESSDVCLPCRCYSTGSYGNACDPISGQCVCRTGVIGRRCDLCSHPFAEVTTQGCQVVYTGCPRMHAAGVLWERTRFGATAVQPCPPGSDGQARRTCRNNTGWLPPDLSACLSTALKQQEYLVRNLVDRQLEITPFLAVSAAAELHEAVSELSRAGHTHVHDVYYVYKLLTLLLHHENNQSGLQLAHTQDTHFIPNIMESASAVLDISLSRHWQQMEEQLHEGAAELLRCLDQYVHTLARSQSDTYTRPLQIVTKNLVLGLDTITLSDVSVEEEQESESEGETTTGEGLSHVPTYLTHWPENAPVDHWSIRMPKYNNYARPSAVAEMSQLLLPLKLLGLGESGVSGNSSAPLAVVAYLQYSSMPLLLPSRHAHDVRLRWGVGTRPRSPLLTLAVRPAGGTTDDSSVLTGRLPPAAGSFLLQLPVHELPARGGSVQCVRWQHSRTGAEGRWTRNGCKTTGILLAPSTLSVNTSYVNCSCSHFSSFAVLVDQPSSEYMVEASAMQHTATYSGLGLSVFLLLVTFLLFSVLRGAMQTNSNSIHKNLAFCLLMAQLLFLTALKLRSQLSVDEFSCKTLAIVQHYAWLCVFSWLLVESVHVLRMLTEMRDVNHGAMHFYYTLGYGLPATVVGLAVGLRADQYGNVFFCWLSVHEPIVWSMAAPILLLVIATLANFVLSIRASFTLKDQVEGFGNLRSLLWLSVVLLPLVSIVWVLCLISASGGTGSLSASSSSDLSSSHTLSTYLLSAAALTLSLYLLLGYCLLNSHVRRALSRSLLEWVHVVGWARGKQAPPSLAGTRTATTSRSALAYHQDELALRRTGPGLGVHTVVTTQVGAGSTSSRSTCKTSSSPYSLGINAPSTTSNSHLSSVHRRSSRRCNGGRGHLSDSESEESTTVGRRSYSLASSHTSDDEETVDNDLHVTTQLQVVERAPNSSTAQGMTGPPASLSWMTPPMADRLSLSTTSEMDVRGPLPPFPSAPLPNGSTQASPLRAAPHLSRTNRLHHSSLSVNAAPLRVLGSPGRLGNAGPVQRGSLECVGVGSSTIRRQMAARSPSLLNSAAGLNRSPVVQPCVQPAVGFMESGGHVSSNGHVTPTLTSADYGRIGRLNLQPPPIAPPPHPPPPPPAPSDGNTQLKKLAAPSYV